MKNKIYIRLKESLVLTAKNFKELYPTDKPLVNQTLNDSLNSCISCIDYEVLKERISEKRAQQYIKWLTDLTCKLHAE